MNEINRRCTLAARPLGKVKAIDLGLSETDIPALGASDVLIRNEYFSFDPSMRGIRRGLVIIVRQSRLVT